MTCAQHDEGLLGSGFCGSLLHTLPASSAATHRLPAGSAPRLQRGARICPSQSASTMVRPKLSPAERCRFRRSHSGGFLSLRVVVHWVAGLVVWFWTFLKGVLCTPDVFCVRCVSTTVRCARACSLELHIQVKGARLQQAGEVAEAGGAERGAGDSPAVRRLDAARHVRDGPQPRGHLFGVMEGAQSKVSDVIWGTV